MELQQLRYVIAVAGTRNFTRAAEECFVVQSSLSHQVRALERELGFALFARTSRRVDLTAAGEAFLPSARASVAAAERAREDGAAAVGRITGPLTIGVIPTLTALDIPAAIRRFRESHPEARVSIRGGSSGDFIDAVDAGTLDIATLGLSEAHVPSRVRTRELARERHVAVLPLAHRLAGRKRLRLSDLGGEPFADFPAGGSGRAQSDLAFRAAGIAREVAFETDATDFLFGLIAQGQAVALLPPAIADGRSGVRAIPVRDGPVRVQYLAWSALNPSPAARAFLESV